MGGWTWRELETMWQHPEWTSYELHELIPRHSPRGIKEQRHRMGRTNPETPQLCCMCGVRNVGDGAKERLYCLCPECYADERRLREQEQAQAVALRQLHKRVRQSRKRQR